MEITEFGPQLLSIYGLYLGSAMLPGPNLFVISATAVGASRSHGVATALGVSTGTAIYSVLTIAGLSAAIVAMPSIATAIRVCGAAYLVYLGGRALLRALSGTPVGLPGSLGGRTLARAYSTGLLTNLANPKALVFYLSLMTLVVTPETPFAVQLAAAVGMVLLSLVWYGLVALALSRRGARLRYARGRRWVDALFGTALIGAGAKLAFEPGP